jgi:phage shock protein PspC (stress-responsive transcriptional regulator)
MNKTVTINLSGIVFHIDENAYEELRKYLDALRRHFANTSGRDEIISDIETRFAEMFNDRVTPGKNVITLTDVQEVINVMGKPEEVAASDEAEANTSGQATYTGPSYESARRRFFRNPDDKLLGGVCSGISAYFDIDPIWLRLAFALSVIFAGTGILLYIILWVIIPLAKTPSEKLQMRGEPVNLASIQKSVQEEMESLKKRGEVVASEVASPEMKARVQSSGQRVGSFFGDVFRALFKFIAVLFGIIITLLSLAVLVALTVVIFSGIGVFQFAIPHVITEMVLTDVQLWWLIIGGLLTIGIPFTLLLLNGLKILFKVNLNLKTIGLVMAGLWLIGIGICILTGFSIASEYRNDAYVKYTHRITTPAQTIVLKSDDRWSAFDNNHFEFGDLDDLILVDGKSDSVVAPFVRLDVQPSDNDSVYLEQRLVSRGNSTGEARLRAQEIKYAFSVNDSVLTLPNYFVLNTQSKYRGQHVKLILKLPVGKSVMLDKSLDWMPYDIQNVTDTWDQDMLGYTWTMTKDGLECKDCPQEMLDNSREWQRGNKRIHVEPNRVIIEKDGQHIEISGSEIKVDTIQ